MWRRRRRREDRQKIPRGHGTLLGKSTVLLDPNIQNY
jgi:hypothetical protein